MASAEKKQQGASRKRAKKRMRNFLNRVMGVESTPSPSVMQVHPEPMDPEKGLLLDAAEMDQPALGDFSVDKTMTDEGILDWWKKCSGLHTVKQWVLNHKKHPAGWAVLLMIHGIPEVTGRLRSKVENYAIYAALFLSFTVPLLISPPSKFVTNCPVPDWEIDWWCEINERLFMYSLSFAVAQHILCIFLAMSFVNALNEAARDSDVFRMFARGKGYVATVKCQKAFDRGTYACFFSVVVVGYTYIGADYIVLWAALGYMIYHVYAPTSSLLFKNASIVNYWREELGGEPDADDPYDIRIAQEVFTERCKSSETFPKAPAFSLKDGKKEETKEEKEIRQDQEDKKMWSDMDVNNDGIVDMDEFKAYQERQHEIEEERKRQELAKKQMAMEHMREMHHPGNQLMG